MQRDLRRAVEPYGNNGRSGAHRGVSCHPLVGPRSGAEMAGQLRTQRKREAARQADLTAMGMSTQHQVELSMCGLTVDLRRVRQQHRERSRWN